MQVTAVDETHYPFVVQTVLINKDRGKRNHDFRVVNAHTNQLIAVRHRIKGAIAIAENHHRCMPPIYRDIPQEWIDKYNVPS